MILQQQFFRVLIQLCLSAEAAIGKFPSQAVSTMAQTIISTEKYKKDTLKILKIQLFQIKIL